MKKMVLALVCVFSFSGAQIKLTDSLAAKLAEMPLKCIPTEYPNKTAHTINNAAEAQLTPQQLHPSFYGCFDWHSSVHGHWMLVRLLKSNPEIKNSQEIWNLLETSFEEKKLQTEADYFTKYQLANIFERTYGWAWLLKLDEELLTWNDPRAKKWHSNLKPLTDKILQNWIAYLPKQTYPNRTGVHPNTAFALAFALDWARASGNTSFEKQITDKARTLYLNDQDTPANLEPDGADFFSPSLNIAFLMSKILPQKEFSQWLKKFYTKKGIENIQQLPEVSDLSDYQTVHLVGLSFSRAWTMKGIANALPKQNPLRNRFLQQSDIFLKNGLPLLFKGNYGGDHWLASFAVYALKD